MKHNAASMNKQRVTAFIDPVLVKRAKVRGALEGLTISEMVEKALDAYAPRIEQNNEQNIHLKFMDYPATEAVIPETSMKSNRFGEKHIK